MSKPITIEEVRPYLTLDEARILASCEEDVRDRIEGAEDTLSIYSAQLIDVYRDDVEDERRVREEIREEVFCG